MWGGQRDQLGLIGFCPAFPHLGHLDRIPSSPAVLFSKRLKTSSMYHPPHQSPASHALSASEGPWLPKFKEDTTPEGNICMQGMGLDRLCITRSHTGNVACGHTVTRGHGGLWAHRHGNIHRPIGPQPPSHTREATHTSTHKHPITQLHKHICSLAKEKIKAGSPYSLRFLAHPSPSDPHCSPTLCGPPATWLHTWPV